MIRDKEQRVINQLKKKDSLTRQALDWLRNKNYNQGYDEGYADGLAARPHRDDIDADIVRILQETT